MASRSNAVETRGDRCVHCEVTPLQVQRFSTNGLHAGPLCTCVGTGKTQSIVYTCASIRSNPAATDAIRTWARLPGDRSRCLYAQGRGSRIGRSMLQNSLPFRVCLRRRTPASASHASLRYHHPEYKYECPSRCLRQANCRHAIVALVFRIHAEEVSSSATDANNTCYSMPTAVWQTTGAPSTDWRADQPRIGGFLG